MPLGQLWHTTAGQVFLCLQHFKHFGRGSLVLKMKPADTSGCQRAGLTFTGCPSGDDIGANGQVKTLSLLHLRGDGWGRDAVLEVFGKKLMLLLKSNLGEFWKMVTLTGKIIFTEKFNRT